jgi:hypothetical protein
MIITNIERRITNDIIVVFRVINGFALQLRLLEGLIFLFGSFLRILAVSLRLFAAANKLDFT